MNRKLIAAAGLTIGLGTIAPFALAADPTSSPFYDRDDPGLVRQSPLPPGDERDAVVTAPADEEAVVVAPVEEETVVATPMDEETVVAMPVQEETIAMAPPEKRTIASSPVEEDIYVVHPGYDERWNVGRSTVMNGEVVRPHTGAVEEEGHLVLTFPSRGAGTAEGYSP